MLEAMARPLRGLSNGIAAVVDRFYAVLGGPGRLLQSFLNGVWLGHSLHAVLVDVVVGGSTAAIFLDVLRLVFGVSGLEDATFWVLALVTLSAVGAILTGLTDYKDTNHDTATRDVTGLHGLVNIAGTMGFVISLVQRANDAYDAAFWVLLVSYLVVSVGAYIGGHVVYKYGYTVNWNAFSRGKKAAEFTPVASVIDVPDGVPTKVTFGATAVMLVRRGEVVHALKDTCAHLGGPLSQGELSEETITCPWHFSTFNLADGAVLRGPATSRQVRYVARVNAGQVELQGPHD